MDHIFDHIFDQDDANRLPSDEIVVSKDPEERKRKLKVLMRLVQLHVLSVLVMSCAMSGDRS